jgi:hypothetical protein
MWNLHQQTGAVAGSFVGAGCTAVIHIQEDIKPSANYVV